MFAKVRSFFKSKILKMNKLQKAEDYVRSRVSKAQERYNHFKGNGNKEKMDIFYGKIAAFDDVLIMLIDLKNEQPEAITDDAHFRKHDVSGSAASEETSNVSDLSSASTSETATVSGNEQTKEVCPTCGGDGYLEVDDYGKVVKCHCS